MKLFFRHSILQKLLLPMLGVVVMQSVISLLVFLGNGTLDRLDQNAFSQMDAYVSARRQALQETMVRNFADVEHFRPAMDACVQAYREYREQAAADPAAVLLPDRAVGERLLELLHDSGATGVFAIFGGELAGSGSDAALVLQNGEARDGSGQPDVRLLYGPKSLAEELGVTLAPSWQAALRPEDPGLAALYDTVTAAARDNPDLPLSSLGYWSRPVTLSADGEPAILFALPLCDGQGAPFGVIGVEIALSHLEALLPYGELSPDGGEGSYVLAVCPDGGDGAPEPVAVSGSRFQWVLQEGAALSLTGCDSSAPVYRLEGGAAADHPPALACVEPLDLYGDDAPYADDRWVLLGIRDEADVLLASRRLQRSLLLAFAFTLLIGLCGAALASVVFTNPIRRLRKELDARPRDKQIRLPRVHIAEIDELSQAIEKMSADVLASSSRLSYILETSDIPIGATEYREDTGAVYLYGKAAQLLHFPREFHQVKAMSTEEFERLRRQYFDPVAQGYGVPETVERRGGRMTSRTIQVAGENGALSWLDVKVLKGEGKQLSVLMDTTNSMQEKLKIEYERDYDVLTQLLNRRAFRRIVTQSLEDRPSGVGAMVMWDLDNLKYINDTYGHDYGDKYIVAAARVLGGLYIQGASVARVSGDEFLAFLSGYHTKKEVYQLVNAVHQRLFETEFALPDNQTLRLRASAGLAWYPENGETYDQLKRYADFAMYEAKRTRKGTIRLFDPAAFKRDEPLLYGQEELNRLFDERLVKFAFQPIVRVQSGEVFAYESLMRPQGETLRSVQDVLKLARLQSKLYSLEWLTWTGSLEAFEAQREAFGRARLFINSVPNTALTVQDRNKILARHREALSRVVLEVIESEQADPEYMAIKQEAVRSWGGQLALDDFGAGYNTEISLLSLNPAYVKIDQAIIRDIDRDDNRRNLVQNIVQYARRRQIGTIAEGIETEAELRTVVSLGVDYVQGFLIGLPDLQVRDIPPERKAMLRELWRALSPEARGQSGRRPEPETQGEM